MSHPREQYGDSGTAPPPSPALDTPAPRRRWGVRRLLLGFLVSLGILVLLIYLGLPLLIRQTMTFKGRPTFKPLTDLELPSPVRERLDAATAGIEQLGFQRCFLAYIPDQVPGVQAYVSCWVNERAGQLATAVALRSADVNANAKVDAYLEFMTRLADGPAVLTNNARSVGAFDAPPDKNVLWCVPTADPRELRSVHQRRDQAILPSDAVRFIPAPGQALQVTAAAFLSDIRRQVESGYLTPDPKLPDFYHLTLRGAYVLTWAEMQPFKRIRLSKWNQLGDHALRQARTNAPPPTPGSVRITRTSPYAMPGPSHPGADR